MAQNKKIKYTKMTAKALAECINEQLKTENTAIIENVLIPSKMKHGTQFIDFDKNYTTHYIKVEEFDRSESDTTVKSKCIIFRNCKLRDAKLVIMSFSKYNELHIDYQQCEIQHFDVQIHIGAQRNITFDCCKVQNCEFDNANSFCSCQTHITTRDDTTFEYCTFNSFKARMFIHDNYEKFVNCKFNGCDFVGACLETVTFVNCLSDVRTMGLHLVCPEKGEYTAFKKAVVFIYTKNGKNATSDVRNRKIKGIVKQVPVIIELRIPKDAKRSSATTRKCRASKAKVISITSIDGNTHYKKAVARWNMTRLFVYEVDKTVVPTNGFDENRWNECAPGIHHFITRDEAVAYDN